MYFWNVKALAADLKKGRISQQEKLGYFLGTFAVIGKFTLLISHVTLYSFETAFLDVIPGLIISIWGIRACFMANRRGDNLNFLDRFFCLSFPIFLEIDDLIYLLLFDS